MLGDIGKTQTDTDFADAIEPVEIKATNSNATTMFKPIQHSTEPETSLATEVAVTAMATSEFPIAVSSKMEELELDIKHRLKRQAMLETDSKQLNRTTQQFFSQLNQQKSQQSE